VFQSSSESDSCYALNYPCKVGGYVIDSNESGNIIRMVNHSDNFNSSFQNVFHDNLVHVICVSENMQFYMSTLCVSNMFDLLFCF
jgi:SET domain-containing protein